MKKKSILILLIITLLLIKFSLAQTPFGNEIEEIQKSKEKIDESVDKFQDIKTNITQGDFLKLEWEKILKQNKYFAPIISFFEKISPVLNPIFKYTVGIEPSLSFLFSLSLVIWISILIYSFKLSNIITFFSILDNKTRQAITVSAIVIVSFFGLAAKLSDLIIKAVNLLQIWWIKLIVIIIIILAFIVVSSISQTLDKYKKETEEEIAKEKLKSGAKIAEIYAEALTKK